MLHCGYSAVGLLFFVELLATPNSAQDINECSSSPCANGGSCVDGVSRYTCNCVAGYTGVNCQTNINECASSPCVNGGTCIDATNNYTCTCAAGYNGVNCQTNTNECASSPCANGGTCVDGVNRFTCNCASGYTGVNCQTNINECSSSPCANGGSCVDGVSQYTCNCVAGYIGVNCQTNINECSSYPCANGGACIDAVNSYTCSCLYGYTGVNCQTVITGCARSPSPCASGSRCVDISTTSTCSSCSNGSSCVTCETSVNECASNPCRNGGSCIDGVNSFSCMCIAGYTGVNCSIDIDECASGPCLNGATCSQQLNRFTCLCAAGFTGTNCETNINECFSNPCLHGGTCVDGINRFTCNCTSFFSGTLCQTDVTNCGGSICGNGGSCDNSTGSPMCMCVPGFTGVYCETNMNECNSSPCQNNGTCTDGVNTYTCRCVPGYAGTVCDAASKITTSCTLVNSTSRSLTFSWTAAPSAVRYIINNTSTQWNVTSTVVSIDTLSPGSINVFTLRAVLNSQSGELTTNSALCTGTTYPDTPIRLAVNYLSPTSITLTWSAGDTRILNRTVINYRTVSTSILGLTIKSVFPPTDTSTNITNLFVGTSYQFSVTVTTNDKTSSSALLTYTPGLPDSSPNIIVSSVTSTSFVLSLSTSQPQQQWQIDGTQSVVYYCNTTGGGVQQSCNSYIAVNTVTPDVQLRDLQPNTTYSFFFGVCSVTKTCFQSTPQTVRTDTDECASNPCPDGSQCIDGINRYTCVCASTTQCNNPTCVRVDGNSSTIGPAVHTFTTPAADEVDYAALKKQSDKFRSATIALAVITGIMTTLCILLLIKLLIGSSDVRLRRATDLNELDSIGQQQRAEGDTNLAAAPDDEERYERLTPAHQSRISRIYDSLRKKI